MVKNLPANSGDTRDAGSIPDSGRSPGEGNGNPLKYSCLENSMDRGALVGYSPWDLKESDTTEQLSTSSGQFYFSREPQVLSLSLFLPQVYALS